MVVARQRKNGVYSCRLSSTSKSLLASLYADILLCEKWRKDTRLFL